MGYHPGYEDDGIYLSAVKSHLDPALYPHDADFFRLQLQATLFDRFIASFARITHISVDWAELLWQFVSLYGILWAAHSIAGRLFRERRAQAAGVALLAAMFTLPVAGTALNIADQHLHPRNLATALILLAVDRVLAGKHWPAIELLIAAAVMHPIMAAFGISLCFFIVLVQIDPVYAWISRIPRSRSACSSAIAAIPLSWIFDPPTPAWRRALNTRTYYFLDHWTWYEWLGAIGPLAFFGLLWFWKSSESPSALEDSAPKCGPTDLPSLLSRFSLALLLYGLFQQGIAILMLTPASLIRLTPLQPMRYLHLEYAFLVLLAGGLLGRHILGRSPWRWAILFLTLNGGMFLSQRLLLPASNHLELPGTTPRNPWLQAFAWIRENTPPDAYFALDPYYLALPGEDFHSFRALAERSQLADALKDAAVVTQVPALAPRWKAELDAQNGWTHFRLADFQRLQTRFGVGWVLVPYPGSRSLSCIWHNDRLAACRIPAPTMASRP